MKRFLSIVCVLLWFASCSDKQRAGGVTDIGNSVAGIVVDSANAPVRGARVFLSSYQIKNTGATSIDSQVVTTDSLGHFHFDHVKQGLWVLHGSDPKGNAVLQQIEMKAAAVDSARLALSKLTLLRGRVVDSLKISRVFIPGSENAPVTMLAEGFYQLDSIPQGDFRLCFSNSTDLWCVNMQTAQGFDTLDVIDLQPQADSTLAPIHYASDSLPNYDLGKDFSHVKFGVNLQDTTRSMAAGWSYSDSLRMDWTGAEPSQTLLGFPLAVRLKATQVNFARFQATGADVRVLDSNGHALSFEIEQWDSAQGNALLWVRLDSIPKRASSTLLWIVGGNAQAYAQTNANPVFSSTNGFAAVYHLAEPALDSGATVHDATPFSHNGFMAQNASGRLGLLGPGLAFNGDSDRVELGTWDPCAGDFSMSLWVNWKGPDGRHQIIMAKRNAWDTSETRWQWHYDYLNQTFASYQIAYESAQFTTAVVPQNAWSYLTLTYSAVTDTVRMWVNGVPVDSGHSFIPGVAINSYLRLGGSDAGESWNGAMDEVQVESVVRSADWIRLARATQNAAKL